MYSYWSCRAVASAIVYINGRATGLQRHVKVVRIILDTETKAQLEWVPIALKSAVFRSSIHRNHVALVHLWPYFFYPGQTLHVASSFSHRLSVSTCHSSCHSVLNLANGQNLHTKPMADQPGEEKLSKRYVSRKLFWTDIGLFVRCGSTSWYDIELIIIMNKPIVKTDW